jgi:hypothetical protein
MFRAYPSFRCSFSRISQELTRPTDREYIYGVVEGVNSAAGAGNRGASGKANSPSLEPMQSEIEADLAKGGALAARSQKDKKLMIKSISKKLKRLPGVMKATA